MDCFVLNLFFQAHLKELMKIKLKEQEMKNKNKVDGDDMYTGLIICKIFDI